MQSIEAKHLKIALLVAGLMLCFAVLPVWPFSYYMLLRVVVCGVCIFAAVAFKDDGTLARHFVPVIMLAILFNPLAPVALPRMVWLFLNLGVAVYFLSLSKKIG